MSPLRQTLLPAVLLVIGASLFGATDVVVLKGGVKIELQKPVVQQGNLALLTRADGTLLSVPMSEIDWKATAAARAERSSARPPTPSVAAPPESPAQAARASKDGPRARVKLTDADVQHPAQEAPPEETEKKAGEQGGGARLEVSDYTQEKSGTSLVVRGDLRNVGGAPAINSKMTVSAMDEKGERIASADAGLSNGTISPGATVSFSVTIPVGERLAASLRFAPQWITPAPPATGPGPTPAPGAAGAKPATAPSSPTPIPYGQGTLYAAPPPAAPTAPPADGNRGYIPGMSEPSSQPKPPK